MRGLLAAAEHAGLGPLAGWLAPQEPGLSAAGRDLESVGNARTAYDILRRAVLESLGLRVYDGLYVFPGTNALRAFVERTGGQVLGSRREGDTLIRPIRYIGVGTTHVAHRKLSALRPEVAALIDTQEMLYVFATSKDLDVATDAAFRVMQGDAPDERAWFERQGVSIQDHGQKIVVDEIFIARLRGLPKASLGPIQVGDTFGSYMGNFQLTSGAPGFPGAIGHTYYLRGGRFTLGHLLRATLDETPSQWMDDDLRSNPVPALLASVGRGALMAVEYGPEVFALVQAALLIYKHVGAIQAWFRTHGFKNTAAHIEAYKDDPTQPPVEFVGEVRAGVVAAGARPDRAPVVREALVKLGELQADMVRLVGFYQQIRAAMGRGSGPPVRANPGQAEDTEITVPMNTRSYGRLRGMIDVARKAGLHTLAAWLVENQIKIGGVWMLGGMDETARHRSDVDVAAEKAAGEAAVWLRGRGCAFRWTRERMPANERIGLQDLVPAEVAAYLEQAGVGVALPSLDTARPWDALRATAEAATVGSPEALGRLATAAQEAVGRAFTVEGSREPVALLGASGLRYKHTPTFSVRRGEQLDQVNARELLAALTGDGQITDAPASDVYYTTETTRRRANVAALRILRDAQGTGGRGHVLPRLGPAQKAVLRGFSGWGGIEVGRLTPEERRLLKPDQQEYLRIRDDRERIQVDLIKAGRELQGRALEAELPSFGAVRGAWEGMIAQYFTPPNVAAAMAAWGRTIFDQVNAGRRPVSILEPSAGIGRMIRAWEGLGAGSTTWTAVELDPDLADMLRLLWPEQEVVQGALEQFMAAGGGSRSWDLTIANPPYAKRGKFGRVDPEYAEWAEEVDYFLVRNAANLAARGVMVQLTPAGVLTGTDSASVALRRELLTTCHLFGAVMPPGDLFPGARLNLVLSVWGKRPRRLAEVLVDDKPILDGHYFRIPGNEQGIMGKPAGGAQKRYAEIIEGVFDPAVIARQPVRVPHLSFREEVQASPPPAASKAASAPASLGSGGMSDADFYQVGETLGTRILRFQEATSSAPARARAQQGELVADLGDYIRAYGNPHQQQAQASSSAAWRALLSVVDPSTGTLAPLLSEAVAVPVGRYQGARDPVSAAIFLAARRGEATLADLTEALERPVAAAELAHDPRIYINGRDDSPGQDIVFMRADEYLSGHVYPKMDWCRAALAERAKLPAGLPLDARLREKLDHQLAELLRAAAPLPIGEIDLGIRTHWLYARESDGITYDATYLAEWVRQEYQVELKGMRVEHGILVARGKDALNARVEEIIAYFNRVDSLYDAKGTRKRRQKEDTLDDRISADRQRDESFRLFIRAHKDASLIAERYNRAYRGYVPRTYSEEPIPIARMDPVKHGWVHPYQWSLIRRAVERRGGIEAPDVGLGKTLIASVTAALLRERGEARRIMFLVPNTVGPNWLAELAMWLPDFRVVPIGFTVKVKGKSVTSTEDSMETVERKLRAFAAGAYDAAIVQHSTFEAFTLDPDNVEHFYSKHFAAQREGRLADQRANAEARKITSLEADLEKVGKNSKRAEQIREQIMRLQVFPWVKHLQAQIDRARAERKPARTITKMEKELEKWAAKQSPTERQQATDHQKFQAWVEKRIRKGKIELTWEQIGVDALFIDEFHEYKNLFGPATRYGEKLKYMGAMGADQVVGKCWDLWAKCAWLREQRGDTGVWGLTATPLKNSPLEAFNLLCYVTDLAFRARGLLGPEDFIERYCQGTPEPVLTVGGGFDEQLAVKTFTNLGELRQIFETWVDVRIAVPFAEYERLRASGELTKNIVPLAIPEAHTTFREVPMTAEQQSVYEIERQKLGGDVEASVEALCRTERAGPKAAGQGSVEDDDDDDGLLENPLDDDLYPVLVTNPDEEDGEEEEGGKGAEILKAMDRMQKAALDVRLIDPSIVTEPPKYIALAEEVRKRPKCAHIVFCTYTEAHPAIADALVRMAGVPRAAIVMVKGSTMSPGARQDVARRFNGVWDPEAEKWSDAPSLNIVIGGKAIEQGINLNGRTCVIHHLTFPWEPATVQQENGRGVRQGNWLAADPRRRPFELRDLPGVVEIIYYASERSFDGYKISLITGKKSWMAGLLASAENTANNPGASLNGPCAQIIAMAADKEKAKAFCACLENRAAQTALARRQRSAVKQLGRLVMLRHAERIARTPAERREFHQQAELLYRTLRALPAEVFKRQDLLDRAAEVRLFYDAHGDQVWVEGTPVCMANVSYYVEVVDPRLEIVQIREMGNWISRSVAYGEAAKWADRLGGSCEWSPEKDVEMLSRLINVEEVRKVRPDVLHARKAAMLEALGNSYRDVPFLLADGTPKVTTLRRARAAGITQDPLWPQEEGAERRFLDAVKALPKDVMRERSYGYKSVYETYFGLPYPKALQDTR